MMAGALLTLTAGEIDQAAADLVDAERSHRQIGLLSVRHPHMNMEDAYAVQQAFVDQKLSAGRRVIGAKIGLTSRAMQAALGIDVPDSGVLLDDMLFEDGAAIPDGRFIQPRIEAEIAFIMGANLAGGGTTRDDVMGATAQVAPSLEILDTRILRKDPQSGRARNVFDTIADNAANAGLVLGKERHRPEDFDLRWVGAIIARDGEVEETGLGAGVLNDPALSVAWLVNRLSEHGSGLRKGDIVLSGSFIRPVEAPKGCEITADFGPFGRVSCGFKVT